MNNICKHNYPADLCGTCNPPAKEPPSSGSERRLVRHLPETPETDKIIRESIKSPTMTGTILAAQLKLKCEELERDRNASQSGNRSLATKADHLSAAIERLEYERTKCEPHKDDAPGHLHNLRSHWDMDGSLCSWCDAWDQARAALHSLANVQALLRARKEGELKSN